MKSLVIHYLGIVLWLVGCQEEVIIETAPGPPRLVVYGVLSPDSVISVWVSQPKSVLDTSAAPPVVGAQVSVAENDQAFVPLTYNAERKLYRATFAPTAGATYRLRVQAEGFPDAEAITQVPLPIPIRSVESQRITTGLDPDCEGACPLFYQQHRVQLSWNDPAGEDNYYEVDGLTYYQEESLDCDSIGENCVLFVRRYEYTPDLLLSDPTLEEQRKPGEGIHGAVQLSDDLSDGQSYTFDYDVRMYLEAQAQLKVMLRTLHPDLYRYERSKDQQGGQLSSLLFEQIRVHQNIRGGYGIFSSYSQDTVVIALD